MQTTANYGWSKPELTDSPPDITVINPNFDGIDSKIKQHDNDIASLQNLINNSDSQGQANLNAHIAASMPHRFTDGGITYRWGLSVIGGVVNFVYEVV